MSTTNSHSASPGTYTPGYSKLKALMVVWGLLLFGLGLWQLAGPMGLLLFGTRAEAEAVSVIKTKTGLPDITLKDDLQIQANLEPRDRSYVFWNEFIIHTKDNKDVTVRAPVGSQGGPLYPLLDSDGLPTTDLVCYDPGHPDKVVFLWIISTWFIPGMLTFVGLVGILIGSTLFYWSSRPIELPHIPVLTEGATASPPNPK